MNCTKRQLAMAVAWLFAMSIIAAAQEDNGIKFPVEMGTFRVTIESSEGKPIEGVEVTVSGLRVKEDPGSWYGWPVANGGKKHEYVTNARGQVEFRYPKFVGVAPDLRTTTTLTFNYRHSDYISDRNESSVDAAEMKVKLKPGCRVSFTATDEHRNLLNEFGVFISGESILAKWNLENGTIRSGAVPDGKWQTMLVAPRANGATLFSGVLPTNYVSGSEFTVKNVLLSPGLRVRGRLSEDVPRPVRDGIVVSWSQPKPTKEELEKLEALGWSDSAIIDADGNFEFPSLPRSGSLQLIAICRGWVCVNEPRKDGNNGNSLQIGTLLDIDSSNVNDNVLSDVSLQMEPAGSVEVQVKTQDGSPVPDVQVSTWPNQKLEHTGTQLLGEVYPTIDIIKQQIDPKAKRRSFYDDYDNNQSRYVQKTDASGKAMLYDIPLRNGYQIFAGNDQYRPIANDQPDRATDFRLESTETKKIEIVVEKID